MDGCEVVAVVVVAVLEEEDEDGMVSRRSRCSRLHFPRERGWWRFPRRSTNRGTIFCGGAVRGVLIQ